VLLEQRLCAPYDSRCMCSTRHKGQGPAEWMNQLAAAAASWGGVPSHGVLVPHKKRETNGHSGSFATHTTLITRS
jgi:hypothetical protein